MRASPILPPPIKPTCVSSSILHNLPLATGSQYERGSELPIRFVYPSLTDPFRFVMKFPVIFFKDFQKKALIHNEARTLLLIQQTGLCLRVME